MKIEESVEIDTDMINSVISFVAATASDHNVRSGLLAFAFILDQKGKGVTWEEMLTNLEQAWEFIQPDNMVKVMKQ